MAFIPTKYKVQCVADGRIGEDSGWMLDFPNCEKPSLIRAIYEKKQLEVKEENGGLYRFADWLPIKNLLKGASCPVTYKSKNLAKKLGLNNLYITFNGYYPEIGARMRTCSFKETEAYSVCARLGAEMRDQVMVVSSAGNTARAFAQVCSDNNIKLLLTVPEDNINALWFEKPLNPCVKLLCTESGSDYFDAINLGNIVCEMDGFFAEGGAKNIARRDGMSTTMMSAVTFIGRIPDYYFQAVGSGTGAIAAWEANLRFIGDGRFGTNKAKIYVSQNKPFTPMYDAWKAHSRAMLPYDAEQARKDAAEICAKVLSNRKPPYSLAGGLFDALEDSKGDMFAVSNDEAQKACDMFKDTEGIDIYHAAGVATASLMQAIANKQVKADDVIMLNITGGGEALFKEHNDVWYLKPDYVFKVDASKEEIKGFVKTKLDF
ncbi:MAG: cysteate synthase [Bacteroidales bacterium]|nr:cysteate synthase [Bacteroidales bacterium]